MSSILIDTNLLLDDPTIIFKLSKKYDEVVIPITVLKELDKHKTNPDLSYSARQAIGAIEEFKTKYPGKLNLVVNHDDISTNDQRIIRAAKDTKATVATKDISMSIISESSGVKSKLYGNVVNGVFDPYLYIDNIEPLVIEDSDNDFIFDYRQEYCDEFYLTALKCLDPDSKFSKDSWFFVFINPAINGKEYIYANNPITMTLDRIDNLPNYRELSDNSIYLKALDSYQVCAMYALQNADNVLITGAWGSGKSLLSTAYAIINNKNKKTFISRPPIGVDQKYNIGYLPGTLKEKLSSWAMGFMSATYFLFGNTNGQEKNGKTFDFVKEEVFNSKFELIDANSLQGMSLLDDYLLVDEVQYCTIDLMSMILSRPTDESKLIMTGDLAQSYSVKPSNSGLLKLLRVMPHKSMAYIDLKYSYRSELLELADKLQDKTF